MSIGLSMSSVNKIKELADNGDYSLALDILEHQDLSKSLSPQFIRICGEVYYENKRYVEARETLIRAHSMAPMGNKIIYSIIKLYLAMGFRKLAEHYFEIYSFNQNSKDVGSYRIEYMIAKAYKKPVNELYGILVSANDIEHDEEWDYEMLLLHAYIRNKDKYDNGCEEFRAHYRNSARLYMLDRLMSGEEDLESMIYCFPVSDKADDDPAQEAIRKSEAAILADDDLRMHPKDAEIRIMVEDDTPVTSSMKLKQMLVRSKEKKEHKKELKLEEQESSEQKKRSRGLFGFMSKKEEELVEQELEELKSENLDKEQLLEEVVSSDENDTSDKKPEMHAMKQKDGVEIAAAQDMKEISPESDPEDDAKYNAEQTGEDDEQDNFVIEEEPEEVVMIDADEVEDQNESEAESMEEQLCENVQETFDPEFDDGDDGFSDGGVEVLVDEEPVTPLDENSETSEDDEPEAALDENSEISEDEEPEAAFDKNSEISLDDEVNVTENTSQETDDGDLQAEEEIPYIEFAEPSPDMTRECDDVEEEPVEVKGFDFDEAFESLEEFEVDENLELPEELQIDELTENTSEETGQPKPEGMPEAVTDTETEEVPETEVENKVEETPEFEVETEMNEASEHDIETDVEEITEIETEESVELETEENSDTEKFNKTNEKKSFPIFKSSLFPDYNTDGAALYDLSSDNDISDVIEKKEAIISENLKKEENLIGETDRLLARIGIKLNSEFNSILDFSGNDDGGENIEPEHKEPEHVENMSDDSKQSKKEKKAFRLKG